MKFNNRFSQSHKAIKNNEFFFFYLTCNHKKNNPKLTKNHFRKSEIFKEVSICITNRKIFEFKLVFSLLFISRSSFMFVEWCMVEQYIYISPLKFIIFEEGKKVNFFTLILFHLMFEDKFFVCLFECLR